MNKNPKQKKPTLSVEKVKKLNDLDISDLADASLSTMKETLGFNVGTYSGSQNIEKEALIRYWEGVLLVPEITLIVARLDHTIAGKNLIKSHISHAILSTTLMLHGPEATG